MTNFLRGPQNLRPLQIGSPPPPNTLCLGGNGFTHVALLTEVTGRRWAGQTVGKRGLRQLGGVEVLSACPEVPKGGTGAQLPSEPALEKAVAGFGSILGILCL